MTILFTCKKCGVQAASLEGHRCAAPTVELDIPATASGRAARLAQAKAILSAVEERFDRNAYHKAYMKTYMRGWRARRKGD